MDVGVREIVLVRDDDIALSEGFEERLGLPPGHASDEPTDGAEVGLRGLAGKSYLDNRSPTKIGQGSRQAGFSRPGRPHDKHRSAEQQRRLGQLERFDGVRGKAGKQLSLTQTSP